MHENFWTIPLDAIVKLPIQFDFFVSSSRESQCVLVKHFVWQYRSLFLSVNQTYMATLLPAFTNPVDTANKFFRPFLCSTNVTPVHLMVLASDAVYHCEANMAYVDSNSQFTKNMYSMFIECDASIRSARMFAQWLRHAHTIIQRDIQNFLPHSQGYKKVVRFHLFHQIERK